MISSNRLLRSEGSTGRFGPVLVALVSVLVLAPVAAVLVRAVRPEGAIDLEAFGRILGSVRTWRLIVVTVAQAFASCVVTVAVGVPVAWVLHRYRFTGRSLVLAVATVPFVLPSVVVGAAMASMFGPRGLVDLRGSWLPIVAAHLCFNLAVVLRTVGAAIASVPQDLESAARLLGTTRAGAARRVTLPVIFPAVAASAVVVFLFCLTSFGVIVVLGGGRVSTIEVEIWTRATRQFDLSGAGVLCLIQLSAVVVTLSIHSRIVRSGRHRSGSADGLGGRRLVRPRGIEVMHVVLAIGAVLVVSVVPMLALLERSLRVGPGWGLGNWTSLGEGVEASGRAGTGLEGALWRTVVLSVGTSVCAAFIAVLLAMIAVRAVVDRPGGPGDRLLLVPLGVSSTTVGLGLLLLVGRPPVDLRGSWWLVPIGQALVAMPLVVRVVLPAARSVPSSVLESASILGAGRRELWWRVELPMLRRAIGAAAGLALIACLGEFGATAFLARNARPTVPVAIERLLSRPAGAGFGQAMALSCVLVLLCCCVVWVVDRLFGEENGMNF